MSFTQNPMQLITNCRQAQAFYAGLARTPGPAKTNRLGRRGARTT